MKKSLLKNAPDTLQLVRTELTVFRCFQVVCQLTDGTGADNDGGYQIIFQYPG